MSDRTPVQVIDSVVNKHRLITPDGEAFLCLCGARSVESGHTFRLHFTALLDTALTAAGYVVLPAAESLAGSRERAEHLEGGAHDG